MADKRRRQIGGGGEIRQTRDSILANRGNAKVTTAPSVPTGPMFLREFVFSTWNGRCRRKT